MINVADNPAVRALVSQAIAAAKKPDLDQTSDAQNSIEIAPAAPVYPAKLAVVDGKYRAVGTEK